MRRAQQGEHVRQRSPADQALLERLQKQRQDVLRQSGIDITKGGCVGLRRRPRDGVLSMPWERYISQGFYRKGWEVSEYEASPIQRQDGAWRLRRRGR